MRLMTSCELTSGCVFGHVGVSLWSSCFYQILRNYLHPVRICLQHKKLNTATVRYLEFAGGSRGTTHEGPFVMAIPSKDFVMIDLVLLEL